MQSISRLLILSALIIILPLGVAFAQRWTPTAKDIVEACKEFTPYQLQDSANPCYEQVRAVVDEKETEGIHNDRNLVTNHRDESGGGHAEDVPSISSDTVNNVYNDPRLKPAVTRSSSSGGSSRGSGERSGTD